MTRDKLHRLVDRLPDRQVPLVCEFIEQLQAGTEDDQPIGAEALPQTGPVVVTKDGKGAALLVPIDEDTDLETVILSNSPRFWELFDGSARGERTAFESLPEANDDSAWTRLRAK